MRVLLLLAIAVFAIVVLLPLLRGLKGGVSNPASTRRDELVKDPVCQTYVVMSRAVRRGEGEGVTYFCSRDCAERYTQGGRRA